MAEAVLKDELKKRKIRWFTACSAGLQAKNGSPMNEFAKEVLTDEGILFSPTFASRRLTKKMIEESYAVICMTEEQRLILKEYPNVTSMQFLTGKSIADPYGKGVDVYRATLYELKLYLSRVIDVLCVT